MSKEEREAYLDSGGCLPLREAILARNKPPRSVRHNGKTPRSVKNDKAA
jgi:hypothetical protein